MQLVSTVAREIQQIGSLYSTYVVVCDANVYQLHREYLYESLTPLKPAAWLTIPAGEAAKTRAQKACLEDALFTRRIQRDACLIACGGGATSDLVGFCAATYLRGIDYVNIPTTLLAMVDASVGGKTAINTSWGKNSLGAFHPSCLVICDPYFLESLPSAQMRSGFAEVVKYAAVYDRSLFEEIISARGGDKQAIIRRCIAIKSEVVRRDPQDQGMRKWLNFGHTVGHGLELMTQYRLLHGDAVALGMAVEAKYAALFGDLPLSEETYFQSVLRSFSFPWEELQKMDKKILYEVMRRDKKTLQNQPNGVMLQKLGVAHTFNGLYVAPIEREKFFIAYGECINEMEN